MGQDYETPMNQSSVKAFDFAFKWWLFIFITILIPLDFLYRSASLLDDLSLLQLGACFSFMVFFFAILAITIASISLVLAWLCNKSSLKGSDYINKANAIAGLSFIVITVSGYLLTWTKISFDLQFVILNNRLRKLIIIILLLLSVFSIIIIIYRKYIISSDKISLLLSSIFRINTLIALFCTFCSLLIIVISFYIDRGINKSLTAFNKNKLPNIILITFDALTAQHVSLYGYHHKTTPNLDKLGQESYIFDNMYSSSNWTFPSLSSLMTGKHPCNHKMNNQNSFFWGKDKNQNLPSVLKELDYETVMFWSTRFSCPWRSNLRGFDKISPDNASLRFFNFFGLGANPWLNSLIVGNRIISTIINISDTWLEQPHEHEIELRKRPETSFSKASELLTHEQKPFFLWIHIFPPHDPYLPGGGFLYSILKEKIYDSNKALSIPPFNKGGEYPLKNQPLVDKVSLRYDESISYADHEFGKFLSFLKVRGLFDDSILMVSADHGEMFERGYWNHGGPYLYQTLIHVPLIIHLPGQSQSRRIGANVSHVDIAPTILDLLGAKPPEWMDGKSFMPAIKDGNFETGSKYSMKLSYVGSKLKSKSIAVIKDNYKFIKYLEWNKYELYNLRNDPKELINLSEREPAIFSSLRAEINNILRDGR